MLGMERDIIIKSINVKIGREYYNIYDNELERVNKINIFIE